MSPRRAPERTGARRPGLWRRGAAAVLTPPLAFALALRSPQVPRWAKAAVLGSVGYLLLPFDAIPDLTPLVGYTDDVGVLTGALLIVASRITPEIRAAARERAARWVGGK